MAQRKARGVHPVTKAAPRPPRPLVGERYAVTQAGPRVTPISEADSTDAAPTELEALVTTFAFDTGQVGQAYPGTVRVTGVRVGADGRPVTTDSFVHDEAVATIKPGSGQASVTTYVYGLQPGDWAVSASLLRSDKSGSPRDHTAIASSAPLARVLWSWRHWALRPTPTDVGRTRWAPMAPMAPAPAVLPGAYAALVALGAFVGLAVQESLVAREGIAGNRAFAASLIAIIAGLIGAKLWYAVEHPNESPIRGGWGVDGFLVVVAVVGALTLLAFELPVGVVLDASTPGLFMAVAIGRLGCFLTGCCAGRCTTSRWGIWSSDRRFGARRIPAQLLESAAGLVISALTLILVLYADLPVAGAIFLAAFAAYGLARQYLLRLRADAGRSPRKLPVTVLAVVTVLALVAAIALAQPG